MPEHDETPKHGETPEHGEAPEHDEMPEHDETPERDEASEHDEAPERKDRQKHDEPLKRMYQNKSLAMSFVKTFHPELGLSSKLMQKLDPERMELDSTEFIDKEGSKSMSDLVWGIPSRNVLHPFNLRLLVEIQSTLELDMLDRIVSYSLRLDNRTEQNRKPTDPEIRLRACTLYTGKDPWPPSKFREPPPGYQQSVMPLGYQYGRVIDARRISSTPIKNCTLGPQFVASRSDACGTASRGAAVLHNPDTRAYSPYA